MEDDDFKLTEEEQRFNDALDGHRAAEETPQEDNYLRRFLVAACLSLSVIGACWFFMTP